MELGLLMYTSETSVASRSSRNPCQGLSLVRTQNKNTRHTAVLERLIKITHTNTISNKNYSHEKKKFISHLI